MKHDGWAGLQRIVDYLDRRIEAISEERDHVTDPVDLHVLSGPKSLGCATA